jgi:citrate lyase synthetase
MTFVPTWNNPTNHLDKTYAELYKNLAFVAVESIIKTCVGVEEFQNEITGFLQSLDELEIKCRQQDLYQNGRVDY